MDQQRKSTDTPHSSVECNQNNDGKMASDSSGVLSISSCATKMSAAVSQVISLGEKESRKSSDKTFGTHMMAACETLDLAKTNLFVTAQHFEIDPDVPSTRPALCQAAKDILQAVLKVLLVVDDEKVSRILALIEQVQGKLGAMGVLDQTNQLVPAFRDMTDSLLKLKTMIEYRKEDLCSKASRDQLGVCFAVLRKCVPSLSMAMKTVLKYKSNATAQASRDLVLQQMYSALKDMQNILQSGISDTKDDDRQASFVYQIDQVMEFLSEAQRQQLSMDFESTLVAVVGHSLSVSHFYNGSLRELIISACHRILQAKFRLLDLNKARAATPNVANMEDEYNALCEMLLDEICDLEKHVNMTLLHLIVDTFLEPSAPIDKLVKTALSYKDKNCPFTETYGELLTDFTESADQICSIAMLVASSCTDVAGVSDIRSSVQCLETIDPDIIPVVISVANDPSKMANIRHLRLLVKRWQMEIDTILQATDKIVDPNVFLDVTEQKLSKEMESMKMTSIPHPASKFLKPKVHRCLCLAERAAQLGFRLKENHTDPIYRNGLMVFVRKVSEAVALARASANDVLTNSPSTKLMDTMDRRFNLLQGSLIDLRQGLNVQNHPHILSQERDLPRQRSSQFLSQESRPEEIQQNAAVSIVSSSASLKSQPSVSKLRQAMENKLSVGTMTVPDTEDERAPPSRSSGVANVYSWPASPLPDDITVSRVPSNMTEAIAKEESKEKLSSIQLLVNRLLTASSEGDRISTDNLTSDLLGWTNHIVDAGDMLISHCCEIHRKEELKDLVRQVDELAPEVIQRSKFMVSGDTGGQDELFALSNEWAVKLEKARVIVDVAADRWLLLTDALALAMQAEDAEEVKKVLSAITMAQQEMGRLLLKTRFLMGQVIEGGAESIDFLTQCLKDVENLAITIKTSVQVASVSVTRTASDRWQLVQVCRDWSVLMTCVVEEIDRMARAVEDLGRQKFLCLRSKQGARESRLCDILETETNQILELIDCVVSGEATLKSKGEILANEISEALVDVVGVISQTVVSSNVPQHTLFSRLRIGLARCRWIEKALEIRDMVYTNTFELSGCVRHTLHAILDFRETGPSPDNLINEEHRLSNSFLELSSTLKQKCLAAVQLSNDLPRRAAIRSILDTVSELTSKIHTKIKDPELTESDVTYFAEQWGARIKKLISQLIKLDGLRHGTVAEIEKLTKSKKPSQGKGQTMMIKSRHDQSFGTPRRRDLNASHSNIVESSFSQSSYASLQNQASSPLGKSVSMLLKGAEFLDSKFSDWDWMDVDGANGGMDGHKDADGPDTPWSIAHHARSMAQLSSNMALYTKGFGPFKSSEEVVGAAVAMTRHSAALEELGQTLAGMVLNSRCAIDLKASITRMNSMTSQLHIIATALHNSARSFEGDRMLVRNAYNLVSAVKDMLARMESAALLEIREPDVVDDKVRSILSLLSRVCRENDWYMEEERSTADLDDLGLRRMECHKPPTLTTLVKPRA